MIDNPILNQLHSLEAFQQAVDMNMLMSVTDKDGVFKSVNTNFCVASKYSESELVGRDYELLNSGYHPKEFFENMWETLLSGNGWKGEIRNKAKDGSYFWVDQVIVPVFSDTNGLEEFLCLAILISDRKEAELAVLKHNERSDALFNAIPEMISLSTPQGKRVYMNSIFREFFGKSAEELREWNYDFADKQTIDDYLKQLSSLTSSNPNLTTLFHLPDAHGQKRWILWSETGIFDENGKMLEILSLGKDVTRMKEAQEEIANQKRFTEGILNSIPADITVFDDQHRYVFINQQGLNNEGMRNWLIGKTDFDYCELKGIDKKQAEIRSAYLHKAISTGEQVEWIDEHHSTPHGNKYVLRKLFPYKEDGKIKYVIGYGIDVTSVKKADEQKDKYISQLEEIAFTTSHKVRNPLVNIQGLLPLLEDESLSSEERKKVLQYIKDSTVILDDLTRELSKSLRDYKHQLSNDNNGLPAL